MEKHYFIMYHIYTKDFLTCLLHGSKQFKISQLNKTYIHLIQFRIIVMGNYSTFFLKEF